jgi:hypothetical protein
MNDPVNNPSHYNQNGLEVIDVIETYAKDDFRLANVIKYVCRSGYKGNKLQDLRKAYWYLNRVIEELEAEPEEAEYFAGGVDRTNDPTTIPYGDRYSTTVVPSPDRIAGDDDAAKAIKADYYDFDKHQIYGYCVQCDLELPYDQPFVRMHRDGLTLNFCGTGCMDAYDLEEGP